MLKTFVIIYALTVFFGPVQVLAQREKKPKDNSDRILSFRSHIDVSKNGTLLVTETITIYNGDGSSGENNEGVSEISNNNDIKKGIIRDFPTRYADSSGYYTNTGFELKSVRRNGEKEPFNTEDLNNGVRIKIGNKDKDLEPGIYHYQIVYSSNRQILFHAGKDEVYWNVNGSGWVFTADTVSCEIVFPEGAELLQNACYTGNQGSTDHDCVSRIAGANTIYFQTTKKLNAYEGLTVAAAIRKGIISEPAGISNTISFLRSNYIIPALSAIFVFLFSFYYITWSRKGRDPEKGVIYPRFSPTENLSPADCGYLLEQKFGSHLFTSALVDCAVKKQLGIEITREGLIFKSNVYHFVQPPNMTAIPELVQQYGFNVTQLYGQEAKKGSYNSTLKICSDLLSSTLKDRIQIRGAKGSKAGLFALNRGYAQFGCLILGLALFLSISFLVKHFSVKLTIITAGLLILIILIHQIFSRIMSAYSKEGREMVDQLLGFRMYLETAERPVYDRLAPPEKTLDLFEKYLPFAIALKVENAWAEKFEDIMQKALEQGYIPGYYAMQGAGFHQFSMNEMSQGISSGLSNTVSSASTPPSSSDGGSGGGGSSGGGGGGGGGGGW